jgi:flagellar biosynthesis/type III secretory pathway chaperone
MGKSEGGCTVTNGHADDRMDRLERDLERLKDRHEALTQTVEIIAGMQRKNETLMAQTLEAINALANIASSHERRLGRLEG